VVPPAKEVGQRDVAEMAEVAPPPGTEARPVELAGAQVEAPVERAAQPEVVEAPVGKGARPEEVEAVLARVALGHSAPVNAPRVAASIRASLAVPMPAAQRPVSVAIKVTERASAAWR